MKKLICALLLLAMLVPVVAMAAAPAANISMADLAQGNIKGRISFESTGEIKVAAQDYEAIYWPGGSLRSFSKMLDNVVSVSFMPDGTIEEMIIPSSHAMWHETNEYWFNINDPDAKEVSDLSVYDPYKMGADNAGEIPGFRKATEVLPKTLKEVLELYKGNGDEKFVYTDAEYEKDITVLENGVAKLTNNPSVEYVDNKFKVNLGGEIKNSDGEPVEVLVYGKPAEYKNDDQESYPNGYYVPSFGEGDDVNDYVITDDQGTRADNDKLSVALIDGDAFTLAYLRGQIRNKTAIGPVVNQGGNYRVRNMQAGNKSYYDAIFLKNGEREVYFIYGDTYKTQTAYDDFNRMASHEYWDSGFTYWGYFDGTWETASNGGKGEWKTVKGDEVSDEALRSLALTKVVAEYGVEPVTSVSEAEAGLPIVLDDGSALGGAQIGIESTINNEETTTFEIEPMKDGKEVDLAKPVQMYLPLPNGFDKTIAENYGITIDHEGEIFSSIDGSAQIEDEGILITATSYSPYKVMWGASAKEAFAKKPANNVALPSTGDNSNLMAFACLLAVSAAALLVISKRRAHQ